MALSREDKADVKASFGKKAANAVSKATRDGGSGMDKALKGRTEGAKKRGNYSIFKLGKDGSSERVKHNMSHKEMHHELKTNTAYRGTDTHGFGGRRTYERKK